MPRNPVNWFEIYVSDMARAKKFYEAVFGTRFERIQEDIPDFEMWKFPGSPELGGANGALCQMKGFDPGRNSVIIYFSCMDCADEAKKAVSAGGRVQRPKMSIGEYGFISLVVDTEGNIIGLHSLK